MAKLRPYAARYTQTTSGYMGQLVEWPELIAEGKTPEECWAMLQATLAETILTYRQQHKEIPPNRIIWWAQYPQIESRLWRQPGPDDHPDPRLQPGTAVRLKGKPDRVRHILKYKWHSIRYQYVYIVETDAEFGFEPYWFAEQLEVV